MSNPCNHLFYCLKCLMLHENTDAQIIFTTGYRQEQGTDYPLGYCRTYAGVSRASAEADGGPATRQMQ